MKLLRLTLIVALAVAMTIALAPGAKAFHAGGVAECVGCHSMHSAVGTYLLTGTDASSTCLNCHENATGGSYHISTAESAIPAGSPPLNMTPGGDFAWLKKDYTWNPGWAPQSEDGETHGHNIIAADFNYDADSRPGHNLAPGGSFPNANLSCISCHDNHGGLRRLSDGTFARSAIGFATDPIVASGSYNNSPDPVPGEAVGVYRLLRGAGDSTQGVTYVGVFNAVVPSSYNRSEAATPTRVAYGDGASQFCATCHPDMHSDTPGVDLVHPINQNLGSTIANNYNAYVGSGDLTGSSATSYDSLVPFQSDNLSGSAGYTTMKAQANSDGSDVNGPTGSDRVTCQSCHRSHASGWMYMTRSDVEIELIAVDGQWPGTDAAAAPANDAKWAKGRTVAERTKAYNEKPATSYATYQRVLCNKCHAKD